MRITSRQTDYGTGWVERTYVARDASCDRLPRADNERLDDFGPGGCGRLVVEHDTRLPWVKVRLARVLTGAQRGGIGVRVGTALYEAAARDACRRYRKPLASDNSRSKYADTFWRKQAAKGRATLVEDPLATEHEPLDRYVLTCPAPASLAGRRLRKRR